MGCGLPQGRARHARALRPAKALFNDGSVASGNLKVARISASALVITHYVQDKAAVW